MANARTSAVQAAVNTVEANANREFAEAQRKHKSVYNKLRDAEKVRVQISPMYVPYLGENVGVRINGYPIYIPADGQGYEVPKPYANALNDMITRIDDTIRHSEQMSNVQQNVESYAGERSFIRRA